MKDLQESQSIRIIGDPSLLAPLYEGIEEIGVDGQHMVWCAHDDFSLGRFYSKGSAESRIDIGYRPGC